MSHNEAYHFTRLGRLLERADKTSRILDVKYFLLLPTLSDVGTPIDTIQWASLLKSTSALEMYRKVQGRITPENVAGYMILDNDFPRAIRYCANRAGNSCKRLPAVGRNVPDARRAKTGEAAFRFRVHHDPRNRLARHARVY